MRGQLTKRISELLMDVDDAPQAADSVRVNGQSVPESYNSGQHYVELAYLTPAEQNLLGQVDMYNSNPPHPGPAGIPNFNGAGGGGGGGGDGGGDGNGDGNGDPDEGEDPGGIDAAQAQAAAAQAEVEAAGMPTTAAEAAPPDVISDIDPKGQTLIEQTYIQRTPNPLLQEAQVQARLAPPPGTPTPQSAQTGTGISLTEGLDLDPPTQDEMQDLSSMPTQVQTMAQTVVEDLLSDEGIEPTPAHLLNPHALNYVQANNALIDHFNIAAQEPNSAVGQTTNQNSLVDMVNQGLLSDAQAVAIAANDISQGGLGSMSPAAMWGSNSETGNATMQDLVDLNFELPGNYPGRSYEINEPQPTAQGVAASHVLANLNPTFADVFFTAAGFLPGVGGLATIAGGIEGRGALNLIRGALPPAVTQPFSNFLDPINQSFTQFGDLITQPFTNLVDLISENAPSFDFGPVSDADDIGDFTEEEMAGPDPSDFEVAVRDTPPAPDTTQDPDTPPAPDTTSVSTLLPAVSQNLPPQRRAALGTYTPPPAFNLPPVFTEEDARALLQQTGQLPLAGIV